MPVPQLLLTLSPTGDLQIELPANGGRRLVPVKPGQLETTARRILEAQLHQPPTIGNSSDPSVWQVRHWNQHVDVEIPFRDPQCPFCRDDNISDAIRLAAFEWKVPRPAKPPSKEIKLGDGSVTVKYLAPRRNGKLHEQHSTINPEDLGI
jgi:hypothetical protein